MRASANKSKFTIKQITKQQRYYRYFATGLGAFLLAYVAASIFMPVQTSDAREIEIANNATGYYITITEADANLELNVEATPGGALASATDTINVKTNSPTGYSLYLYAGDGTTNNTNNLYKDGSASTASSGYFSPVVSDLNAPAILGLDTWGFALDQSTGNTYSANFADKSNYTGEEPTSSATYAPVPTSSSPQILYHQDSKTSSSGNDLDIYYGINATTRLVSGTYSNTITYTAVSEATDASLGNMQDFTADDCMAIGEDGYAIYTDSRDGKDYMVSRLKDGNCWMVQNLALDPSDSVELTPENSNVSSNWTMKTEYLVDGNGTTPSTNASPQVVTTFQKTMDDHGSFYGNYYNFMAATAGAGTSTSTGTITQDICPRGWHLPDNAGNKSYSNLMGAYGLPTSNTTNADAVAKVQQSPLLFPLAGRYYSGIGDQGLYGSYWSRTIFSDSDRVYRLYFNTGNGNFHPKNNDGYKALAGSVRCVFNGQASDMMQNFTLEMCQNLTKATKENTADVRKNLVDARDGKIYQVSRLADDNCWMVSNLALDGTDYQTGAARILTTADSNVTKDRPLAANISSGTTMGNTAVQIFSGVANNYTASCSFKYCIPSTVRYGNHYNWIAATAGVGNATEANTVYESVCPSAGGGSTWRLPDNGTVSGAKTYSNLLGAYNLPTTNSANGSAVQAVQRSPLSFPLTGYYTSSAVLQGYYAYYWSRTSVSGTATNAYYLHFNSSNGNFYPQDTAAKSYGFSVRCVLGE